MLENEFKYYTDHQDELVSKYGGYFIVIKDNSILGAFNSQNEAFDETIKKEKLGTFLIQHCLPGSDSFTQTFHSQVILIS